MPLLSLGFFFLSTFEDWATLFFFFLSSSHPKVALNGRHLLSGWIRSSHYQLAACRGWLVRKCMRSQCLLATLQRERLEGGHEGGPGALAQLLPEQVATGSRSAPQLGTSSGNPQSC